MMLIKLHCDLMHEIYVKTENTLFKNIKAF